MSDISSLHPQPESMCADIPMLRIISGRSSPLANLRPQNSDSTPPPTLCLSLSPLQMICAVCCARPASHLHAILVSLLLSVCVRTVCVREREDERKKREKFEEKTQVTSAALNDVSIQGKERKTIDFFHPFRQSLHHLFTKVAICPCYPECVCVISNAPALRTLSTGSHHTHFPFLHGVLLV